MCIYLTYICVACLSTLWLSPNMCIFACSCFCHPQIVLFATKDQTPLNGQLRHGSYSGTFGGATKRNHAFERCSRSGITPFRWWLAVDTMEATPAALKPFAIRSSTAPPARSFNIDLSLVDDIGADLGGSFLVSCTENSRILCLRWNKYENDRFEVPLSSGFVKACKNKARPKLKGSSSNMYLLLIPGGLEFRSTKKCISLSAEEDSCPKFTEWHFCCSVIFLSKSFCTFHLVKSCLATRTHIPSSHHSRS